MVLLKSLKKQINHFIASDTRTIDQDTLALISKNEIAPQKKSYRKGDSSPYSHGLEKIYELENVDPKTIRTFGEGAAEEAEREGVVCREKKSYSWPQPLQRVLPFSEGEECAAAPIDLEAMIQSSLSSRDELLHFAHLEQYHLEKLVTLTPLKNCERKRASAELRARWAEESRKILKEGVAKEVVERGWNEIVKFHIIPWLRGRHGVAFDYEIDDFLEQSVASPYSFGSCIDFIISTYYGGEVPYCRALENREGKIYFASLSDRERFEEVEELLFTYFYRTDIAYKMEELICWLLRESAKRWLDYDFPFVEHVLSYSSFFAVKVDERRDRIVTLLL